MGDYTTVEIVKNALTIVASSTQVGSHQISTFIDYSESWVNGRISGQYSVPVTGLARGSVLEAISTEYSLYQILRRLFTQQVGKDSSWVDQFKSDAEDKLGMIADGKLQIVNSGGAVVAKKADSVWHSNEGYEPTFTEMGELWDRQDPDKLDDLYDDRYP